MNQLRKHRKPVATLLIASMTALMTPAIPAQAAIIGTDQIIAQTEGSARDRIGAFLAREDVRSQLETMGIAREEVEARVAALSDREVAQIAGKLDTLPAGEGAIGALVGAALIVFIVLLITDLLGLTHVFSFTNKGSAKPN